MWLPKFLRGLWLPTYTIHICGRPILPSQDSLESWCCNMLCCGMLPQVWCLPCYQACCVRSLTRPSLPVRIRWICLLFRINVIYDFPINAILETISDGKQISAGRLPPPCPAYLLGLLAMIKCSICSYQCDNWYVSNWRLACHINFCLGRCSLELAQRPLRVALAWHFARRSAPFGVTEKHR